MAGGNLPFGFAPSGSMSSYTPTLRERAADWLRQKMFSDDRAGQDRAEKVMDVAAFTPFGFGLDMYDAGRETGMGNYGGAALTLGMAGAPGPSPKGIRAFHGSPHSFDKFDMSKIGTGEGAQAYGHGLYFAENEGVARGYRDTLSRQVSYDGQSVANAHPMDNAKAGAVSSVSKLVADGTPPESTIADQIAVWQDYINKTIAFTKGKPELEKLLPERIKGMQDIVSELNALDPAQFKKNPGSMYEVNIDADPNAFLDWDKPLSEQPPVIAEALRKIGFEDAKWPYTGLMGPNSMLTKNSPGQEIYNAVGKERGSNSVGRPRDINKAGATQALKEAGIPGIKYLDAGSRGAGDGTRNYVVFDDKLINIVKKYGIAGASAMLGYNILDGMDPAQAAELKSIEGK